MENNANEHICNLTGGEITTDQRAALQYGLEYAIATRPRKSDLVSSAEFIWDQLERKKLLKHNFNFQQRAKTALQAWTLNIFCFNDQRIEDDNKRIEVIKDLLKTTTILKPDKGEGVVLIPKQNYIESMTSIFTNCNKFKTVSTDPTPTRLNSLQKYLHKLLNRNELSEEEYEDLRPKNAHPARAHGLPKIHEQYEDIPKFRLIIDKTGTTHYHVGEFLSKLLLPLTQNEFTLRDSNDAADRIRSLQLDHLHEQGYRFVSFVVESLFANVPLEPTLEVIKTRVDEKRLPSTRLTKNTLLKLIQDTCKNVVFSCNNSLYEHDGISEGGSLGPVLANIILTEFEEKIVKKLMENGTIKFYCRYVDKTLLLIKPDHIESVLREFQTFNPSIGFTYDSFEGETPHFLDIDISADGLSIYREDTFTGLYTNLNSFVPWCQRIAWVRSLICSSNKVEQLQKINSFLSRNGFPEGVSTELIEDYGNNHETQQHDSNQTVWIDLPYIGSTGDQSTQDLIEELRECTSTDVTFRIRYKTTKISLFTSAKCEIPILNKSNVIYQFSCPCSLKYIGMTERTIFERTREHSKKEESAISKHLKEFHKLRSKEYCTFVRNNITILDTDNNPDILLFKEAFYIKSYKPLLNTGLKGSRKLEIFQLPLEEELKTHVRDSLPPESHSLFNQFDSVIKQLTCTPE